MALRVYQGDAATGGQRREPRSRCFLSSASPISLRICVSSQAVVERSKGVLPHMPGHYDTIYFSIPVEKQEIYRPALIIFEDTIRRAIYAVA
jgi:hypothetical protein